ncbi:hypothetical protein LTR62_000828 [Meristemomyces frigidus]|uniref:Carbohydrate kinase PfkB domain-containing protein n=1 Tax=Meristemomyces frigidus TaxID=1508187 RepID=A0AAN7TTI1_9PEZI|nr:hypothetical protein LTR62_000828 [Meristemomyces frigidus]
MTPPRLIALGNGVWLDEICTEGKAPIKDVPGGSITYSVLGARLFTPLDPKTITLMFNAGHDFPEDLITLFRGWSIDLVVNHVLDRPSARGRVFYENANANRKGFERLTEPLPVNVKQLERYPDCLQSQAFHFFGSANYLQAQVNDLLHLRKGVVAEGCTPALPLIVWEPHAKSCLPATLQQHLDAMKFVDVFSPNHEELHSFWGNPIPFDRLLVEREAAAFVQAGIGPRGDGCIIVRAAGAGVLAMSETIAPRWLPSYYKPDSERIFDPTGAGNAFLGGFIIGLQNTGDRLQAIHHGQVAASFALEQVGVPSHNGEGADERWNGEKVSERLAKYQGRLQASLTVLMCT